MLKTPQIFSVRLKLSLSWTTEMLQERRGVGLPIRETLCLRLKLGKHSSTDKKDGVAIKTLDCGSGFKSQFDHRN